MRLISVLAVSAAIAATTPAHAAQVFFDGFENDSPAIGLGSLTNWSVAPGTVDVVAASNPYGINVTGPASGNVLDLDGTPGPAAIYSNALFNFNAGDVITFSFDVGGSQRSAASDSFYAGLFVNPALVGLFSGTGLTTAPGIYDGNQLTSITSLAGLTTPFTSSSIQFKAVGAGSLQMAFYTTSADNVGPLLDNVKLDISSAVPEPATWALMLLGFAAIGGAMRSRRRSHVSVSYA